MFLSNTTQKQQKSLICDFFNNLIQGTNDTAQIANAVNSLNATLYEHGASVKLEYCDKTRKATMTEF